MANNKQPGFNGQWIDIFSTGTHTDDSGAEHEIDRAFLEAVVSHLDPDLHEPPAVIGHPETDDPAYAWVCGLRVDERDGDEILQARFCDSDPDFEQLVKEGKFKKRSAAFYIDKKSAPGGRVPALRHVGFLGAAPPAVKGLRAIHFDEGEAVTFDITFSEGDSSMDEEKVKKSIAEGIADYFRNLFKPKDGEGQGPAFSEAEFNERLNNAVTAAMKPLTNKLTELESANEKLEERLNQQSSGTTRSEIVAFCERLGSGKFLPAFKRMGMIEFMEALAGASDKKVSVITFAEEGGQEVKKKVEITPLQFFQNFLKSLPAFVEFGEKFGDFKVADGGAQIVDKEGLESMRIGMGIAKKEGGDK